MKYKCTILASMASLALHHFFTLSHKWHDFEKKNIIKHKMRVLTFSTTFVRIISHSKKNWARCDHKYILVFKWSPHFSCPIL